MPGPTIRQAELGGSGSNRTWGAARCFAGNRSTTEAGPESRVVIAVTHFVVARCAAGYPIE